MAESIQGNTRVSDGPKTKKSPYIRLGKLVAQAIILALVGWGLWRASRQAQEDLAQSGITIWDLHPGWLVASGVFYMLGMVPSGFLWHRVMVAMNQRPGLFDALRAYFISQPGKYVPGKFMVVVLRTAMIRGPNVDTTLAVASIFVETLTMMSIGAAIGAVMMGFAMAGDMRLVTLAIAVAFGVGVPMFPPVFRRLVKLTRLHRLHPEIDRSLEGLTVSTLWPNWVTIAVGWLVMGFSLWATLRAIPGLPHAPIMPRDLPLLTACIALSTVAGFVSGLPGGLGARELVVVALVQPNFGPLAAMLLAVVHRGVIILIELVVAAILLLIRRRVDSGELGRVESGELRVKSEAGES